MKHTFRFLARVLAPSQEKALKILTPSQEKTLWSIADKEHHHLRAVLRLKAGDQVELFDTDGYYAQGVIEEIGKLETVCHSKELRRATPPSRQVTAVVSALKPKDICDYLPELIEIGVSRIYAYTPEGGQKIASQEELLERFLAVTLSAFKQSKATFFPKILYFHDLKSAADQLKADNLEQIFFLDQTGSRPSTEQMQAFSSHHSAYICGSEKGFSEKELLLLKNNGFSSLCLSNNVLRASTAAVCGALFFCCLSSSI